MIKFTDDNKVIEREAGFSSILVGVYPKAGDAKNYRDVVTMQAEDSLSELEALVEAAEGEVIGVRAYYPKSINPAFYMGRGAVEEIADLVAKLEADTVVFDSELSGIQLRNLEEALNVKVIDRTILILDIFASRATSKEGSLQVEHAQLKYRMSRLTGFGKALSRPGGGIGTRGPGEKKLETDRRHIESRLIAIENDIKKSRRTRNLHQQARRKSGLPIVALVGYTNVGKSAIMNKLLDLNPENKPEVDEYSSKKVFEKNQLFATLDTHHRRVKLDSRGELILIDTVGFVSKLPHSLISAFKSTLEELKDASVVLHVQDISSDHMLQEARVTKSVMKELGVEEEKVINVYNKSDLLEESILEKKLVEDVCAGNNLETHIISAKTGSGLKKLINSIYEVAYGVEIELKFRLPFDKGDVFSKLCKAASSMVYEYDENGIIGSCKLIEEDYNRFKEYEIK